MMKSILIADDHDLFREGLKKIIERWPEFTVIGEASNGMEVVEQARSLLPDIILMDIFMPVMDGIDATRQLSREFPCIRIVMLTASDDDENLFEAISHGASGYILKNTPVAKLHTFLLDIANDEVALSSLMAEKIIHGYKRITVNNEQSSDSEALSEREKQILELLVQGLTNAEIGKEVFLSEHSVKKYIGNILQKLHLKNRVEAVVYAIMEDIVQVDWIKPPVIR